MRNKPNIQSCRAYPALCLAGLLVLASWSLPAAPTRCLALLWPAEGGLLSAWEDGTVIRHLASTGGAPTAAKPGEAVADPSVKLGTGSVQALYALPGSPDFVALYKESGDGNDWALYRLDPGLKIVGEPVKLGNLPTAGPRLSVAAAAPVLAWHGYMADFRAMDGWGGAIREYEAPGLDPDDDRLWLSDDGRRLAAANGKVFTLYDRAAGRRIGEYRWDHDILGLQAVGDSRRALVETWQGGHHVAALVRLPEGRIERVLVDVGSEDMAMARSAGGKTVAIHDNTSGGRLWTFRTDDWQAAGPAVVLDHLSISGQVRVLALSPDGSRAASVQAMGRVVVFKVADGSQAAVYTRNENYSLPGFSLAATANLAGAGLFLILLLVAWQRVRGGRWALQPFAWHQSRLFFFTALALTAGLGILNAGQRGLGLGPGALTGSLAVTAGILALAGIDGRTRKPQATLRVLVLLALAAGGEVLLRQSYLLPLDGQVSVNRYVRWQSGLPVIDEGAGLWFYPLVAAGFAARVSLAGSLAWWLGRRSRR